MLALVPMLGGLALVVAYGIAIANANEHVSAFGVAVVAAIVIGFIAVGVTTKEDKKWLPTMIMAGFTAKLIASTVRWWVLVDFYQGSGDAVGYHKFGHEYVHLWRTFHMPPMASGTEAMEGLVGLVYVPYAPNFLGGFYMFATLAFIGQIFCYMAFRNATVPRRNKLYAVAIFFVPTIVYWPSSIGKESVIVLGLGIAAYGLSRVLAQGSFGSLVTMSIGLLIAGIIRPHISAMVAAAGVFALVFSKGTGVATMRAKRLPLIALSLGGLAVLVVISAANFNITLESGVGEIDEFVTSVEGQTTTGGSSVEGGFISSPLEFPEVTLRVLFRPLPYEAHNPPAFASSLEGAALLLLVIWKFIPMVRRGFRSRRDPYMLFCIMFTFLFIIAFSSFLNLGLMARERSQVMPFFLAMIVALGFGPPKDAEDADAPETAAPALEGEPEPAGYPFSPGAVGAAGSPLP